MAEVVLSVVAKKLAEYLVDPTIQQLQYLFCVGEIITNVEEKKNELALKQREVQKRVEEAKRKPERMDDEVNNWKNETVSLIEEVESLVRANSDSFHGWCPTWRRYRLCKMLAKTSQRMTELTTRGDKLEQFFHPLIVQDIEYHSSKDFMLFKSTELAFNELLKALRDDINSMIGLWGMGGSGKTTLVKQVGKKAKALKLFDRVIIATVSQTPDIKKIQGEIADLLGLKFEEETEVGRARRIALRLRSPEERILIILDDVWAMLNLEDIGNPFGDDGPKNCKVLLTTRIQDVCPSMLCKKTIPLGLLEQDEAWDLFQAHAKVDDGAIKLAQQIVTECSGLPIAIVVMGKCLRRKGLDEVNVVLHQLRHSKPVDEDTAFTCLKLSYDYLRSEEAKSLFLMCAMFPEDHEIIIEDLFRYGVGLGLCKDAGSFELARNQVIKAINVLIDSSLLISSIKLNNKKCVKMHDMVRDVALRIAHEKHRAFMVNSAKELNELIVNEEVKNWYAFSSWYYNTGLLPFLSQSYAPELQFLLFRSGELFEISHATFEGTKGLKALIIMCSNWSNKIELQPQSIQHLSGLRTLRLQGWNLHDISFVVSLTRLEILDLQGSEFARVPDGIENLNKLKLLDLSLCRIDECCYKIIGRCSQLEELYVFGHSSHPRNTNCYEYLGGSDALLKFSRYNLEIGEVGSMFYFQNAGIRSLSLGQLNISLLGAIIKDLAQRATAIQFYELEGGSKCFTPNIVQAVGGMNELTKLCLERCSEIECLTDETTCEDAVLHRLDELKIQDMGNLKQLCLGPAPFSLFQKLERLSIVGCPQLLHIFPGGCNLGNLKFLEISDCPMMTSIFPISTALGNLKFLEIYGCPMMTSIFPISTACTLLSLEKLQIRRCNELKHVLAGEGGCNLGNLMFLEISDCPMMASIFPISTACTLLSLEKLQIRRCIELKHVLAGEGGCNLGNLKFLEISDCPMMTSIFPISTALGNLKFLEIYGCPMMTSIFPISTACTLLSLEKLQIRRCNELKHVLAGEGGCNLGNLKFLEISDCPMMTSIFPISTACTLLSLEKLQIRRCNELKHVLAGEGGGDAWGNSRFPKLKMLCVNDCCKLEYAFPVFLVQKFEQLQDLSIENAPQMKFVFGEEQPMHDADETQIVLPPLEHLHLRKLPNLVGICSKKYCLRQSAIKTIKCRDCPSMKWQEIRDHQLRNEEYNPLTAIESITLVNCGPEFIFPYQTGIKEQIPTFQYLQELNLDKCARLKVVFSAHTHQCLPNLTCVNISCCEELEAIYRGNEETQKNLPIVESCLLKLKSLKISKCNKLKFIFHVMIGATTSMLPQLSNLTISDCSQMEEIFKCSNIEDHDSDNEREIRFLNLENMELKNLPRLVDICQGFKLLVNICQGFKLRTGKFCGVVVHECPKLMPIMNATILWTKERLVRNYELKKYHQLTNNVALNHPLSVLNVGELDIQSPRVEYKLQVVGDEEQEETNDPEMLGGLVPTQILSFQYLHSLEVTDSKKFKFLFSISTIVHNSLPKLNCLTLSGCEELEVIFRHSGEGDANYGGTIVLSSLRKIQLKNLPKFMNVCQIGLQIQVELRHISICNCPKFVNSSLEWALQPLGTISLPQVSTEDSNLQISSNADQLPGNEEKGMKMQTTFIEYSRLEDSINLTSVCEGPTLIMFQNLEWLHVSKCRRLKCILPSTVMRSLPCLEYLRIEECEELEEVMSSEEEEDHNHFPDNSLCFPQLFILVVKRCRKLKWLFPSTLLLPQLKLLTIEECSELKGVCNSEGEFHEEGFYNKLLPGLISLTVKDCPMFSKTTLAALQRRARTGS